MKSIQSRFLLNLSSFIGNKIKSGTPNSIVWKYQEENLENIFLVTQVLPLQMYSRFQHLFPNPQLVCC